MENNIVPFNFEGKEIRSLIDKDGNPWFVAIDVCRILEIEKPENVYSRLDEEEKDTCIIGTHGGNQKAIIINESGLYSLILTSRKPEAKKFKKWVTSEVLPSIRKTGSYSAKPLETYEIFRMYADQLERQAKFEKESKIKFEEIFWRLDSIENITYSYKFFNNQRFLIKKEDIAKLFNTDIQNVYRLIREYKSNVKDSEWNITPKGFLINNKITKEELYGIKVISFIADGLRKNPATIAFKKWKENDLYDDTNEREVWLDFIQRRFKIYNQNTLESGITENDIENELAEHLTNKMIPFQRQLRTNSNGRIDIITDEMLIEIKICFTVNNIKSAIGQIEAYQREIGYDGRLLLIAQYFDGNETMIRSLTENTNVEVWLLEDFLK